MAPRIPGKPVWLEISSQRIAEVERFYPAALGWTKSTTHVEPWGALTMFRNHKRPLGTSFLALSPFHASHWNVFLSGDPDALAAGVGSHGGGVVAEPEAAPGWGRTAELYDPHGNTFTVIDMEGGDPRDPAAHGDCVLAELRTPEATGLADFYARLFGYDVEVLGDLAVLSSAGHPRLLLRNDPQGPTHHPWIPWFRSASPQGDAARAERFGAIVQLPAEQVAGVGTASVVADPSGAYFGLVRTGF